MVFLNDMGLFVEVVKAGSFRGAAKKMGMPSSTLSRRISALEKTLGLRLLNRTTRKVELTEAGTIYFERCKRIVAEANLAHEQLGEMLEQPRGTLRVSLPVDFAITFLAPMIAEFARHYAAINFEFNLTPRRVDLISEPFDVAIRMGESEDSQLIARSLARLPSYVYASPVYLQRLGEPINPDDLKRHECLNLSKTDVWTLQNGINKAKILIKGRFKIDNVGMIRRLATLDLGIILMPEEIVATEVANGELRRVLPQWQGALIPVYAITESRLIPAKTQRFIEFLRNRLAKKNSIQ